MFKTEEAVDNFPQNNAFLFFDFYIIDRRVIYHAVTTVNSDHAVEARSFYGKLSISQLNDLLNNILMNNFK